VTFEAATGAGEARQEELKRIVFDATLARPGAGAAAAPPAASPFDM